MNNHFDEVIAKDFEKKFPYMEITHECCDTHAHHVANDTEILNFFRSHFTAYQEGLVKEIEEVKNPVDEGVPNHNDAPEERSPLPPSPSSSSDGGPNKGREDPSLEPSD